MPVKTLKAVTVDTTALDAKLQQIAKDDMPFARMLAINELAKDTIRIEKLEMMDVFDRPKPFVIGGLRQLKRAKKKESPQVAVIGFTDVTGRFGSRVEDIVRVHIEGQDRGSKAAENRLKRAGVIAGGEYLVRARSAPTDRYGNVTRKIWTDAVQALSSARSTGRTRYFINQIGSVKGIFRITGKTGKPRLIWIVTRDRPDYRRRFDFYGEAQRHADKFGPFFAREAVNKALKTAR